MVDFRLIGFKGRFCRWEVEMLWLPFSIFAACCLAQFWFIQRVASVLEARHTHVYRRLYGLFALNRLFWFAIFRRDRGMNDPDLTQRTKQLQLLCGISLASWLTLIVLMMTGHH